MSELIEVPAGLANVAVTATTVGDVLGDQGVFHYRGRSAVQLAQHGSFEDAAALVLDASGDSALTDRELPPAVGDLVGSIDLRTGISALGHEIGTEPLIDIEPDARRERAVAMISMLPTLIASVHHGRALAPRDDLGHVSNYVWMLTGDERPEVVAALQTYCILTIEHGFNSSTFAARVIASTGADLGAAITGAYGALSGPRHGAVQGRVLDMYDGIGEPGNAEAWMINAIEQRERIMGFGHAVYRKLDPRAAVLRDVLASIAPDRHAVAVACEEAAERVLAGRRLAPNVDLYACVVLEACGIPPSLFTATFAMSRVVGWCAHILEQAAEPKVLRPAAYYIGDPPEV